MHPEFLECGHPTGYPPAQLNGDEVRKKATSVRLSRELLRRVREMMAATGEAASVTEAIEIALEDWLEDREAELQARGLPNPNGPVSDLPGPREFSRLRVLSGDCNGQLQRSIVFRRGVSTMIVNGVTSPQFNEINGLEGSDDADGGHFSISEVGPVAALHFRKTNARPGG
jgi:Arc/MetJ-type ribon-helix-helix transcriptional regulator